MDAAFKDADMCMPSHGAAVDDGDKVEGKKIQDSYKGWITDERKMGLPSGCHLYAPVAADRNIEVTTCDGRPELGGI